jgi:hypothetical protein
MRRRTEENGLKDNKVKTKIRRRKTLHCGSVPVYILQQRFYAILQRLFWKIDCSCKTAQ